MKIFSRRGVTCTGSKPQGVGGFNSFIFACACVSVISQGNSSVASLALPEPTERAVGCAEIRR